MTTFGFDLTPRVEVRLDEEATSGWIEVDTRGPAGKVLIRLGISPEGRLACTGLIAGVVDPEAGELTARQLRAIPLAQIIAMLAPLVTSAEQDVREDDGAEATERYELRPEGGFREAGGEPPRSYPWWTSLEGAVGARVLERAEPYKGPRARPGPKGHPSEHFERVAAAYREALITHPRSPMKALTIQLQASDATVRRWVQRARDKGLLGPSVPGKAGETQP